MYAHRAAVPLLEPDSRLEGDREDRGRVIDSRGGASPHLAVGRDCSVDSGLGGPAGYAEVDACVGGRAHLLGTRVKAGVGW